MLQMCNFVFLIALYSISIGNAVCQENTFTKYDSLRGSLTSLRTCYDVTFYDLNLKIDIKNKSIQGFNNIYYIANNDFDKIQVDLFSNLRIDSIVYKKEKLAFQRDSNAVFINFKETQKKDSRNFIAVYYSGKPLVAKKAPWDGGFVWSADNTGKAWVGVACEGTGASLWWPCKDHPSDEPDSMQMSFSIPSDLYCVANGNLISEKNTSKGYKDFVWKVHYPINNYNVTLNIGDYFHFSDTYLNKKGEKLNLDYYVLKYNADTARKHFTQVKKIISCYEKYFGDYPFQKDGYALVETPYWGMEHQSAIAYGNNYKNTLFDFDFIIAHESAHEWWGNSLSASDVGELWIHEAFATYAEALLVEYYYGKESALKYLAFQKTYIKNKEPMLMPLHVNYFHREDSDIYYKGSWMLHSLRNTISNDTLWFQIISGLARDNMISTINTQEVIAYFNKKSGKDLSPIFKQYLKYTSIPLLIYKVNKKRNAIELTYKWEAEVKNFNMPVFVELTEEKKVKLYPSSEFKTLRFKEKKFKEVKITTDLFYIETKKL